VGSEGSGTVLGAQLSLLGWVRLTVAGRDVDLGPARQRTLLAVLAVSAGQPVPLETLVDRVWGDRPPSAARAGVYAYMSRLRQVFAGAGLPAMPCRAGAGGYLLDLAADRVDLLRFQRLVAQAHQGTGTDQGRAAALDRALALWRGPALADLAGPWVLRTRESLALQRLDAVLLWAELHLRLGQPGLVIGPLRELAGQYPLVEPLAARLIEALGRDGRPAEALAAYAATRRVLITQLGTEPGAELRRRHEAILAGEHDSAGGIPASPPPGATPARPPAQQPPVRVPAGQRPPVRRPAQLPRAAAGFTGRQPELATLDAALPEPGGQSTPVAAVTGTAGVGKTALVVHWAHRVRDRFPDGQLYVDLRGYSADGRPVAPTEATRLLLDGLGVPAERVPPTLAARTALYRSLLADQRVLVVLDNARGAGQARPLLPGAPGCLVVVASRDRLTPLVADCAQFLHLDLLTAADARTLLARRLGTARIAAEPAAVEQIIAGCAGLPLALTIAAARAIQSGFPLGAIAAEFAEAGGRLDLPAVDELRAAFARSYEGISADAAALFRRLGTHPGRDVTAGQAADLTGQPRARAHRLLTELAEATLLVERSPGRYSYHSLLRAYAADLARATEVAGLAGAAPDRPRPGADRPSRRRLVPPLGRSE
jgi:DNA-binding SARP family transcriptional activator